MPARSHRSHQVVLSALVAALAMVALPGASGASGARPADTHGVPAAPVNAPGTDVAAPDQQVRSHINARGTDVAARDQQGPRVVLRRHGTSVASHDNVNRTAPVSPAPKADATAPIDGTDDSGPAIMLQALIALALGLAGVGFASWLVSSRKRSRATV